MRAAALLAALLALPSLASPVTNSNGSVSVPNSEVRRDQPVVTDVSSLYARPPGGIPASDLSAGVRLSLSRADSAVRSVNGMTGDVVIEAPELPSKWALSAVTNAQGVAASSVLDGKRDKTDMAVYGEDGTAAYALKQEYLPVTLGGEPVSVRVARVEDGFGLFDGAYEFGWCRGDGSYSGGDPNYFFAGQSRYDITDAVIVAADTLATASGLVAATNGLAKASEVTSAIAAHHDSTKQDALSATQLANIAAVPGKADMRTPWMFTGSDVPPDPGIRFEERIYEDTDQRYLVAILTSGGNDVGEVILGVDVYEDDLLRVEFDFTEIEVTCVATRRHVLYTEDDEAETYSLEALSSAVASASAAADEANAWSTATYAFMTGGRTNCWWSGTNYVFGADAATRRRFAWEDGMDAATVPCSMALYEIREGVRERVWDQRDWTAWYWSFKAGQMETNVAAQVAAALAGATNDSMYAWARRYASDGARNPDPTTTFVDTPAVAISPGMRWETVATVSGAAYWTVVGNGAVIGGSGTNATLSIRDFEGNEIMTVTKGEHRMAWLESGEFVGQMTDAQGRVCFDMLADAQPVGHFSTTTDADDFVAETDDGCPADYEWESLGGGKWRIHFLLKPGIEATSCFAKFLVEVEGQTVIRYNAGQEIRGGLIYNGVRIAPDVSGSPAAGTVVQWKVVQ